MTDTSQSLAAVPTPPNRHRQLVDRDTVDPLGLGPLTTLPLVPEELRRKHSVVVPADGRFKQAARFLQALWREDRELPIGRYRDGNGKMRRLGSMITPAAGDLGANFIDPDDLPVVNRELIYREVGAIYDLDRLKRNLLSSQPLVFNAAACLKRDLALATRVFAELLPGLIAEVTQVFFEHSGGRGDPRLTRDNTAFDLAVRGRSATGSRVFVGLEFKYSEGCLEPVPRFTGCYDALAPTTGLFVDPTDPDLRANPIQQLFRLHCHAAAILKQDLADTAVLAVVAPEHNKIVQAAADAYGCHLLDPRQGWIPFATITLERLFAALAAAGRPEHARRLHRRYTDWWLVDGELDLAGLSTVAVESPTGPEPHTEPAAAGSRSVRGHAPPQPVTSTRSRKRP